MGKSTDDPKHLHNFCTQPCTHSCSELVQSMLVLECEDLSLVYITQGSLTGKGWTIVSGETVSVTVSTAARTVHSLRHPPPPPPLAVPGQQTVMMKKCCLMSSDVSWHIRDKLWPMPKHGSTILYVRGNQKVRSDRWPRTATSTLTQLLNYEDAAVMMKCCLMSSDVSWHIRDKLWPMPKHGSINLYVHGNQKAR